jgi:hypothetical protein
MGGASCSAERPKLVPSELGCNDAHQPPLGPHVSIHRSCRVAHPSASIAHTSSFICPNASRQVSTHPSRPSSLLHYDACYLYGKVAVCVAVAVTCDTCLRYGAAAHASLPGQNALPSSCTRTHAPQFWVSPCTFGSAASDHLLFSLPCRSFAQPPAARLVHV